MRSKKITINGIKFDSKAEMQYYFKILKPLERSGKILDLKVLDNRKDFKMLYNPTFVLKNNKKFKTGKVAYTADFSFYNKNSNFFPYLPDGVFCFLEYKSEVTEKKTDYRMRRSIFISKLKVNEAFIEVVEFKKKKTKITVYLKN